ncbi:MAG: cation transporter, partial [Marinobacter sp.]|nr:cation transporter [Marinobacter sp.]
MNEKTALHPALSISGASCQGCVRKIRSALEPLTGSADRVDVNLEEQTVALPDGIETAEAARIVTEAGYPASPLEASPTAEPASEDDHCHVDNEQARTEFRQEPEQSTGNVESTGNDDQIHLAVTGATCASCVNTIEKALKSVDGITGAHMNLADNTATATGHA